MPQFRKPERSAIVAAVRTIGLALATTVSAAETPAEAQERLIWEHALRADRDLGSPWGYHDYLKFHPDQGASFAERIFWLSLLTCPTCRKLYKPAVLWQTHCTKECEALDPRQAIAAMGPQHDPLASPALPWEASWRRNSGC